MRRCFIAFELDPSLKACLRDSVEPIRRKTRSLKPRFLQPEAYHITLRFLGAVGEARLAQLRLGLGEVVPHHTAFTSRWLGFGGLPRRAKAHVLVAVLADDAGLAHHLHQELDQLCAGLELFADRLHFKPHATLARFKAALDMRSILSLAQPPTDPVQLTSVVLYESTLAPSGAKYSVLERFALRPSPIEA